MYLNLIKLLILLFLIICLKVNIIISSIIIDRNKLNDSSINKSLNVSLNVSSNLIINQTSNILSTLNESINQSIDNQPIKKNDFINKQKNLIQNLVKEDNLNKLNNEINNLNDSSTNSIIDEELINEFKLMNNKSKNLEHNLIINNLDDKLNETIQQTNDTLILKEENDNIFNLKIDNDCIFVRSVEGIYTFNSIKNHTDVCGLYSIADSNQIIEYTFLQFNVHCGDYNNEYPKNNQSLVTIVDGWELNGQFFPSLQDHLLKRSDRYKEICINNNQTDQHYIKRIYRVSQNVGLIQFRVLNRNEGFKVSVRFIENNKPCNVLLRLPTGIYTLKNYGQTINCSISVLFPESIRILSNSIANKQLTIDNDDSNLDKKPSDYYDYQLNKNQTDDFLDSNNTILENDCFNKLGSDYMEFKGGDGLDTDLMLNADKQCFYKDLKRKKIDIDCINTAIRLVSSGLYDNSVTLALDLLDPTESSNSFFKCPQKSLKV